MKLFYTNSFKKDFKKLPDLIQNRTTQKIKLLVKNLSHPSLRVKKVQKYDGILEGTINKNYRILFQITSDSIIFLRIGKHNILEQI
ncbi:MAG: type II toxin-antitoxin system mRNA interferase toxin, RelE/StbE family [Atribacterota bacterium]|jgi:addiction module RelE/StbE family toxin|nr:type II toxin-antitoxin system mRNA interferase toxin, RelE/StbE family [Atribacterota bacterium]